MQKLILEELHHRIKNTLATVSAIASQSLRTATSIEHGQHAIEGRLVALGRAHDLLLQARWADQVSNIRSAARPSPTSALDGPDLNTGTRDQDHVGGRDSARHDLNELCTNTTKFGALSVPAGRIEIVWKIDEAMQRLHLTWSEKNGPMVHAPSRQISAPD